MATKKCLSSSHVIDAGLNRRKTGTHCRMRSTQISASSRNVSLSTMTFLTDFVADRLGSVNQVYRLRQ